MEDLLFSAIRLAVPVLFLALGEMVVERAGVLNLGIEGMLVTSALGAALGAEAAGPAAGLGVAVLFGVVFGLIVAAATVVGRVDQVVTGLALNLMALGFTGYVFRSSFAGGQTFRRIGVIELPVVDSIPFVRIPFRQSLLVYVFVVTAVLVRWWLYRTRIGLCLRAIGDDPEAVDAQGLNISRVRIGALVFAGVMGGFAGGFLVLAETGRFTENMSGGRGFLAIAAVVFGAWRLSGVLIASLLFGLGQALQFELPAAGIDAPNQLWLAFPYLLALAAIAVLPQRGSAPKALMKPFVRGER